MEARILHQLRVRGLYHISMAIEAKPTSKMEKSKLFNRMDEAHGLLCMFIFPDPWFQINACKTPNEI
jgi:hypothetical protein